jgi:hypothetical protein
MSCRTCQYCGFGERELRPYGKNGANVCYDCAMLPEHAADTEAAFKTRLAAAGPVAMIGTEAGPVPYRPSRGGKA